MYNTLCISYYLLQNMYIIQCISTSRPKSGQWSLCSPSIPMVRVQISLAIVSRPKNYLICSQCPNENVFVKTENNSAEVNFMNTLQSQYATP